MKKGRDAKPHIGIFGRRNFGKSSLINALAGQDTAIVSEVPGTTTDPVKRSFEIFGIGPSILIDTAGIDDTGDLGRKRVDRSMSALKTVDLAILLITGNSFGEHERKMLKAFKKYKVPFLIIHNKSDIDPLKEDFRKKTEDETGAPVFDFSALNNSGRDAIIATMISLMPETAYKSKSLLGGLLKKDSIVLLVTPIDSEAPEGRLILPQVQTIRDILDNECVAVVTKENGLGALINKLNPKPDMVITDSQAFGKIAPDVPEEIWLTSFSILMASNKGDFESFLKGTPSIDSLKDGDRVLMLESCSHQVSCEDIGRFKIPEWMQKFTGKKLEFDFVTGKDQLPQNPGNYSLVIQCGGCVMTRKQVENRLRQAIETGVPVTNYGMAIAWMNGIFNRATGPFREKTGIKSETAK